MTSTMIDEHTVRETLREVIDPELGCNIVDLGLLHAIAIDGAKVTVQMTLTTPGCPMQESLVWGVQSVLLRLDGVADVEVELVWDPPWSPDRMTAEGRARLGVR